VGYATALDVYILICFFFSFASLAEFALINFLDTYTKRLKKWEEDNPQKGHYVYNFFTLKHGLPLSILYPNS
jgi:hypothetical protein